MSSAYDLLNSLVSTQAEEDDKTLVIDHYTRVITIPKGITSLGVENDDDVLRLNFKMPRYLGTVDLYTFKIRINYMNAQGKDDIYDVTDAAIVGDYITFSWKVGPTATAYRGTTMFNVSMVVTDSDSVVQQVYNTQVASLPVRQGLECSKRAVSKYSDILAQWESRLFGFGDTEETNLLRISANEQQNIIDRGAAVRATIPPEYQTTANLAEEGARTKADAIICSAEGDTIAVSDSSDDYLRGLKIFGKTTQAKSTGKNLLNPSNIGTFLNNTGDEKTGIVLPIETDGTYSYYVREDNYTVYIGYAGSLETNSTNFAYSTKNSPISGNVTLKAGQHFTIWFDAGISVDVIDPTYFFLALGENIPYEPYSGGIASPRPDWPQDIISTGDKSIINVAIAGKNLLNITTGGSVIGVTETVTNGLVSFSGTATGSGGRTAWARSNHVTLSPGTYTMCMNVPSGQAPQPCLTKTGTTTVVAGGDCAFTIMKTTSVYLGFNYTADTAYNAENVSVRLEVGDTATEYEPFKGINTIALSGRGIAGIPVTSGGNYTDANGQQWISDEVDFERGVYVQKVGRFTLANDRTYYYNTDTAGKEFFYTANGENVKAWETRMYCSHFPIIGGSVSMESDYWMQFSGSGGIRFRHKDLTSLNALATWLVNNSVNVCYVLETPIETPLTADEIAVFKELKSNYPNTTVINDSGAGMLLRYNADTKTWINNLIDEKIAAAVAKL